MIFNVHYRHEQVICIIACHAPLNTFDGHPENNQHNNVLIWGGGGGSLRIHTLLYYWENVDNSGFLLRIALAGPMAFIAGTTWLDSPKHSASQTNAFLMVFASLHNYTLSFTSLVYITMILQSFILLKAQCQIECNTMQCRPHVTALAIHTWHQQPITILTV